jgi:hypothetical protein
VKHRRLVLMDFNAGLNRPNALTGWTSALQACRMRRKNRYVG